MPAAPASANSLRAVPGAIWHCALLTVLTITLAAMTGWTEQEALLRPLFYALLYSFFSSNSRRYPELRTRPMRLVQAGFAVLMLGAAASAVMLIADADHVPWMAHMRLVLDRGAIFLLGTVLVAYGLFLWVPMLLEQHRKLAASFVQAKNELHVAERARSSMEQKLIDQHRLTIVGELAASVAHDLRNPLAIVKGAAQSLLRKTRSKESVSEHAEVISRGVDKADHAIQALIDLGRPHEMQLRCIPLCEPVREVLALVRIEGRRRHLHFVDELGSETAFADRDLLVQVLLNLVLNAAQASPDNGTIDLRVRHLTWQGKPAVAIAIEDRGSGLPTEVRRHLFTPFFTTRRNGTGLGLLSSKRILSQMNGKLGLYPRTRGGARAILLLPANGATSNSNRKPAPPLTTATR
ncbi:MAG: hypothetical protein EXS02_13640 [Planctomycetes bacterium]|nr:hypothetical protein [Planctomycetota bacterium]